MNDKTETITLTVTETTKRRPLSRVQKQNMVRKEMLAVRHDWPGAQVSWGPEHMSCTLVIREPGSTYIVQVLEPQPGDAGAPVESLWVSHRAPIGPDGTHIPAWEEGWVD